MAVERLIRRLQANDRAKKEFNVRLYEFRTDQHVTAVARALRRNIHAEGFTFFFGRHEEDNISDDEGEGEDPAGTTEDANNNGAVAANLNWDPLLRVLEHLEKLEVVVIENVVQPTERLLPLFFSALQRNGKVKSLFLDRVNLSSNNNADGFISFLDDAPALEDLMLQECSCTGQNSSNVARNIATALRRKTSIQTLQVSDCEASILCPIFQSLASSNSASRLKKLIYRSLTIRGESESTAVALQQYLVSDGASELNSLKLNDIRWGWSPILSALMHRRTSIKELGFDCCYIVQSFNDQEDVRDLVSLITSMTNLHTLIITDGDLFLSRTLIAAMEEVLIRRDSTLRCLGVSIPDIQTIGVPLSVLTAVSKSTRLERLVMKSMDTIYHRDHIETLAYVIPLLKVDELSLWFDWRPEDEHERLLLEAFKRNFSFQSVKCNIAYNQPWFSGASRVRLASYLARNHKLVQWLENPKLVPRDLWPLAMTLALKAGMNSLYLSLLALSGEGVGLRQRGRKRKRPQYYKP